MELNTAESIRVAYFGTPDYAVPALDALIDDPRVEVALVVTQPDRPAGRGRKLTPPPVKIAAERYRISVYQPETLRTEADRQPIADARADLFVVAAFGKIFGPRLLALPPMGSVNLHASILPDFRGASPIAAAILEGNFRTGVTLMSMDVGLDTGPILAQRSIDIEASDTTASLTPRLAELGANLLIDSLDDLLLGRLRPVAQDDAQATITRQMVKADGWIEWSRPAREIERHIRAMWDWPRAWTTIGGDPVQIHKARISSPIAGRPGSISIGAEGALVATGDESLAIEMAQAPGGKPLDGNLVLERAAAGHLILGAEGKPPQPAIPLIRPVLE